VEVQTSSVENVYTIDDQKAVEGGWRLEIISSKGHVI